MAKKNAPSTAGPSGSANSPPSPTSSTASHPPSAHASGSLGGPDEDPKKAARRERNRLAASAFRNRKKERLEGLEGKMTTLETENTNLKDEVSKLMEAIGQLHQQARDRGMDVGPLPSIPSFSKPTNAGPPPPPPPPLPQTSLQSSFAPNNGPVASYFAPAGSQPQASHQPALQYSYQQLHQPNMPPPQGAYSQPDPYDAVYAPPPFLPHQQHQPAANEPPSQPLPKKELTYNHTQDPHHPESYFPTFNAPAPAEDVKPTADQISPPDRKRKASETPNSTAPSTLPPRLRRSARGSNMSGASASSLGVTSTENSPLAASGEEGEDGKSLSPDTPVGSMGQAAARALPVGTALAAVPIHLRRGNAGQVATEGSERSEVLFPFFQFTLDQALKLCVALDLLLQQPSAMLPPLPSFPGRMSNSTPGHLTPSFPLPTSLFSPNSLAAAGRFLSQPGPPLSPFINANGFASPFAIGLGHMPMGLGSAGGIAGANVSDIRTPSPGTSVGGGDGYFWGNSRG